MNGDRMELEAKIMFVERTLEGLHEAMVAQGRQILKLEQQIVRVEQKIAAKDEPDLGPHDSPPPHYGGG